VAHQRKQNRQNLLTSSATADWILQRWRPIHGRALRILLGPRNPPQLFPRTWRADSVAWDNCVDPAVRAACSVLHQFRRLCHSLRTGLSKTQVSQWTTSGSGSFRCRWTTEQG